MLTSLHFVVVVPCPDIFLANVVPQVTEVTANQMLTTLAALQQSQGLNTESEGIFMKKSQ